MKLGNFKLIYILDDYEPTEDDSVVNNKIVKDMMKDIKNQEQFRILQKIAYMSRENRQVDYELLHENFNPENKEKKLESQKEAFFNHQKAYVDL